MPVEWWTRRFPRPQDRCDEPYYIQSLSMANHCAYDIMGCFWVTTDVIPELTSRYENRKGSSLYSQLHGKLAADLAAGFVRVRYHWTGGDPSYIYAFAFSSCGPDYDGLIPGQDVRQTPRHRYPRDPVVKNLYSGPNHSTQSVRRSRPSSPHTNSFFIAVILAICTHDWRWHGRQHERCVDVSLLELVLFHL